jgi:hypothetical protein
MGGVRCPSMVGSVSLEDFDAARREFESAFATIPDGALSYLKPGDEYSLGGLLVHVNWVLIHYERVLNGILDGGFAEFRAIDPKDEVERTAEQTKAGLDEGDRRRQLALTAELHERLRKRFEQLGEADWARKAPVLYGPDAAEPYPTSAADVEGWLRDHYREHVPQIGDLVAAWRQQA